MDTIFKIKKDSSRMQTFYFYNCEEVFCWNIWPHALLRPYVPHISWSTTAMVRKSDYKARTKDHSTCCPTEWISSFLSWVLNASIVFVLINVPCIGNVFWGTGLSLQNKTKNIYCAYFCQLVQVVQQVSIERRQGLNYFYFKLSPEPVKVCCYW